LGAAVPDGGAVIATLQFRQGRSWKTFRQLHFGPGGRRTYRATIRFRRSADARTLTFRVRVPAQSGLNYATGVSPIRTIRVTS
jgi:hypothetical protein